MQGISLWSNSLLERVAAEDKFNSIEIKEFMDYRLSKFGFSQLMDEIHDGNHLRLNAFWLFIGAGNSDSELWDRLPRKDITLGKPHIFERISSNFSTNKVQVFRVRLSIDL